MTQTDSLIPRSTLRSAFQTLGYEVLPFKGTFDKISQSVPKSVHLTVTASPPKGIEATVDLATRLAEAGYSVAPHLSARMIADQRQLVDIVQRLNGAGISGLFVVGGDGEPKGTYTDALSLLRAIHESEHRFTDIGIGGYPEGHALIEPHALNAAMDEKAALAQHITTQICFSPEAISAWALGIQRRGINLPVRVGMPGAVSRQKLIRISASIGLGDSARFLQKQQSMFWRFFLPGGYSPNRLIQGLKPALASDSLVQGFHIFTFNELQATEEWRQRMLQRYAD